MIDRRRRRATFKASMKPSWPGLSRPSTDVVRVGAHKSLDRANALSFVDARNKSGHDEAALVAFPVH
jgi:hypothetical protein